MARFCPLFSSSSGNCTYIACASGGILIDAGVSAKKTREALFNIGVDMQNIGAIFVTHEHIDHIRGMRVLAGSHGIRVYTSAGTLEALEDGGHINGKVNAAVIPQDGVEACGMHIRAFPTSHDARQSVGYLVTLEDGRKVAVATDTGVVTDGILDALTGSDLVMLESNHDVRMLENGPYPYHLKRRVLSAHGHLSNAACASTITGLVEGGTTRVVLAHLSKDNNFPRLAYETAFSSLSAAGAVEGRDYTMSVACEYEAPHITVF